jgi:hypothetical protein
MVRFFVLQESKKLVPQRNTCLFLKSEVRSSWYACQCYMCLLFYYKFQAVSWVVADISPQRTGVQTQANQCRICSGKNVRDTGISPGTANALFSVNPSELHIQ